MRWPWWGFGFAFLSILKNGEETFSKCNRFLFRLLMGPLSESNAPFEGSSQIPPHRAFFDIVTFRNVLLANGLTNPNIFRDTKLILLLHVLYTDTN